MSFLRYLELKKRWSNSSGDQLSIVVTGTEMGGIGDGSLTKADKDGHKTSETINYDSSKEFELSIVEKRGPASGQCIGSNVPLFFCGQFSY